MQGASATGQLLKEITNQDIRVFVVWEPVLFTDFTAPSTAALARVPDSRVTQYWDSKRALSHLMGEQSRASVVWDYIAVFTPGTTWQDTPPKPGYSGGPVKEAIGGTRDAIEHLAASVGSTSGRAK